MWVGLAVAVCVAALLCYIPGHLFFSALGFSPIAALCTAPIYSVCLYATLPIVYYELGISCNSITILVPTVGFALCGYSIARIRRAKVNASHILRYESKPYDPRIPALYVGLAVVVCTGVFVFSLASPDAFFSRFDNQVHLNLVRSFLDSGKWSSLHTSNHLAAPPAARSLAGNGGFYPAAWHDVVALVCSICSASVPVGTNALIIVTCAVMLPLGSYALLASFCPNRPRAIAFGAITTVGFANWPWMCITSGPLYPFILGLVLLTSALAVLIADISSTYIQRHKLSFICFAACAVVALALAHPSVIFTAYIICAGLGAKLLWRQVTMRTPSRTKRIAVLVAYALLLSLLWFACYHVPALQSTFNYNTNESISPLRALGSLLSLRFSYSSTQVGMMIACAVGIVAIWCGKDARWLFMPIFFFAVAYLFTRMNIPILEHWACGPWYSDMRRLCENLTILLIPMAAVGMDAVFGFLSVRRGGRVGMAAVAAIVLVTLIPYIWVPASSKPKALGLGRARNYILSCYGSQKEHVYGSQEVEFVNHANELMPPGSLVINAPADGSVWAYAVNGTNTYYRTIRTRNQTDDAKLIRLHLSEYATNQQVRDAVRRIGATYVLLLDQGVSYEDGVWMPQYSQKTVGGWVGIDSVNDNTPGFVPVLAKDDMRLYRIVE